MNFSASAKKEKTSTFLGFFGEDSDENDVMLSDEELPVAPPVKSKKKVKDLSKALRAALSP